MNDGDAIYQTILHDPEDNNVRLIYADWLQEQNTPSTIARAEFIRLQVERSTRGEELSGLRSSHEKERKLFKQFGRDWVAQLPKCLLDRSRVDSPTNDLWEFRRGFIERITLRANQYSSMASDVFSKLPIRELWIEDVRGNLPFVRQLANSPLLAQLSTLHFVLASFGINGLGDQGLRELVASPHLGNLRTLNLQRQRLSDVSLEILAECSTLTQLRELRLGYNRPNIEWPMGITAQGLAVLAQSKAFPNLRTLELTRTSLGVEGAETLANSRMLSNLESLTLSGCHLGTTGLRALANSRKASNLRFLDVQGNKIGVRGASALGSAPGLSNLVHLNLTGNQITQAGVRALSTSSTLDQLRFLSLRKASLGDLALNELIDGSGLPAVMVLDLRQNDISPTAVTRLARSSRRDRLKLIDLRQNDIPADERQGLRELFSRGVCRL